MFECVQCGNCCRHHGYVRLRRDEIDSMAVYLNMSVFEFTEEYTRLTRERGELSLVERADGSCCFLDESGRCAINEVKPAQCRAFPLKWNYDGFENECPGVKIAG